VPTFQHQFPICTEPARFSEACEAGKLDGVSERAIRVIDGFQPYQVKSEARRTHPLRLLSKLSNRDKHHMLAIAALNAVFDWKFVGAGGRI
jgi:hypothetical protein